MSDATKGRIADLASGWSVDAPSPDPEPPPPRPRPAAPTQPPPRAATSTQPPPTPPVRKPPTQPPPQPPPPPVLAAADATIDVPLEDAEAIEEDAIADERDASSPRGDATSIDPGTIKFERADPTAHGRTDDSIAPARAKVGRLRTVASLRSQRGIYGDVRYVATVLLGVRRSRRELLELDGKQAARQQERERYLVTLGRTAIITDNFDHPALGPAREKLGGVEDERARHTGSVVAADQELQRVTRDREAKAKQYATDLAAVDAELAELTKRLEPLHKQHGQSTRKAGELRETLRRIDAQIQETTASLVAVRSKKDPAAIQAELATLKADREAIKRDEPVIAAELDSLSPKIAATEAKRSESTKRRSELIATETDDKGRTEDLLAAIGAKRKVMDRAAKDAETLRDKILFELAERLYVDRPGELTPQLAPIDAIDVELGSADRRGMELREILSSVDRWKLARGIAVIVLALAIVGGITAWILYLAS